MLFKTNLLNYFYQNVCFDKHLLIYTTFAILSIVF